MGNDNGEVARERIDVAINSLKRTLRAFETAHRNTGIFAEYKEDYLTDLLDLATSVQTVEDMTRRVLN